MIQITFEAKDGPEAKRIIDAVTQVTNSKLVKATVSQNKSDKSEKTDESETTAAKEAVDFKELTVHFKAAMVRNFEATKALLPKFKVKTAKELKEKQYEKFINACKAIPKAKQEIE